MSDDLVAHLRALDWDDIHEYPSNVIALMEDAAAEIARLRAALANARRLGMEEAISEVHARAEFWMSGNNAEAKTRYDELRKTIAAIRAAAKEEKP